MRSPHAFGCLGVIHPEFVTHVEPLPGAVPKIQQPYSLSAFDRLRLKYHKYCEVAEGKDEWSPAGEAGSWGSPSFAVCQASNGLLVSPVRYYRYPNSQTYDAPWPSANASAVLNRSQRGAIHTTLDCIWGVTELGIDSSTADILQLVCR